ncbi:MAG TPA: GntR family transcriptional regulator [Vicinamibacterales bacterium]|jgi:GntR family transcriptional regulator|nr:GntR family transcriptional regulator [Vicinamibacterales bacterium]
MLPFSVSLREGVPVYEQVTYAVTRAIVSGQLRPGDLFPSVRTLSQELKINPNTAHRIVAALVEQGLLVVRPGIGTEVADASRPPTPVHREAIEQDADRLTVAARRAGLTLPDILAVVRRQWARLTNARG